jgi:hypothetical protein
MDRPASGLVAGDGGVIHASQPTYPPRGFLVVTDAVQSVQYGTYLGGELTQVNSIVSQTGRVYVAGNTLGGLPMKDAFQPDLAGGTDGFVAVFDDNGMLLWSTYLGGSGEDSISSVWLLADGSVVVSGATGSSDFPSAKPSALGKGFTFFARLRPD